MIQMQRCAFCVCIWAFGWKAIDKDFTEWFLCVVHTKKMSGDSYQPFSTICMYVCTKKK